MWEVGSVSDSDEGSNPRAEDDGDERKGVGGKGMSGERRGLLDEEDGEAEREREPRELEEAEGNPFADDDEDEPGPPPRLSRETA